jgi:hypothetical protein
MIKLRGTLVEQSHREQLLNSWLWLKEEKGTTKSFLKNEFGDIQSAFMLSWTPEQFENLYTILVNGLHVVYLEILRENDSLVSSEIVPLKEYERKLRYLHDKIQLAVALDIIKKMPTS